MRSNCLFWLTFSSAAPQSVELIRARTGHGRKRAKARGVKFGRPRKLTNHQRQEALARLAAGETQADIARTYAGDPTTIGRLQ
jgi:DNA invertase Pin-like site-specific DNA recombinase